MPPRARKSLPVCPVCDSTEYVLRQGEYFCRMCNTQSQELGMETVMDEETAGLAGGMAMCDSMSLGSRRSSKKSDKERLRRRKMMEAETWTTAEAYSWVLRGWVIELKKMDIDVEAAVLQLWSLYLRQLKMGFERKGEEGCIETVNLKYIDKLKIIGAAPGMRSSHGKRRKMESPDEEEFDEAELSMRKRRRMRKKRRDFFQTFSDAESLNESRTSGDITSDSETDISDDGKITDSATVKKLMKSFARKRRIDIKTDITRKNGTRKILPYRLTMNQLASLLALAVISRPGLSVTLEDMARLFNNETLRWRNACTYLPQHYTSACSDINFQFQVSNNADGSDKVTFDHQNLGLQTWRLATYLSDTESRKRRTPDQKRIVLLNHNPEHSKHETESQFVQVLTRVLDDLSLPSSLTKDITRTFAPLHLLTLSTEIGEYKPNTWAGGRSFDSWPFTEFPSVLRRLLALILLCLKFHFSLDDQFEYYHSHNIDLIRKHGESDELKRNNLQELASEKHFDVLEWIRFSKLRLDYLMSRNICIRDQFSSLSHIGTPDLTREQEIEKLKYVCPPREGRKSEETWEDISKLLEGLSLDKADSMTPVNNTTQPLLENTKLLVNTDVLSPRVKAAMEKLLDMPNFTLTLRLIDEKVAETLFTTIQGGKWSTTSSVKKVKQLKILRQDKPQHPIKDNEVKASSKSKTNFDKRPLDLDLEMMHGRIKRSQQESVTIKSKGSKYFATLRAPAYWFSGPQFRTDRVESVSPLERMVANKHVLHGLPDNFSWCLQYFASYAQISNVSLLQELSDIENLILHLDKDYFGYLKTKEWLKIQKYSS